MIYNSSTVNIRMAKTKVIRGRRLTQKADFVDLAVTSPISDEPFIMLSCFNIYFNYLLSKLKRTFLCCAVDIQFYLG